MNRNNLTLLLMLSGGLVTCVITVIRHYTVFGMLLALFIVLVFFFLLGTLLKDMLNYFDRQNEIKNMEAGEVIEKESEITEEGQSGKVEKTETEETEATE